MTLLKSSLIYKWINNLCNIFSLKVSNSMFYTLFINLFVKVKNSNIINYLFNEDNFINNWKNSVICNFILSIINLIPNAFSKFKFLNLNIFRNSKVISLSESISFIIVCGIILFMFIMPQDSWSNLYSLFGILVVLLFYILSCIYNRKSLLLHGLSTYMVIFILIVCCSTVFSFHVSSLRYFSFFFTCILFLILLINIVKGNKRLSILMICISAGMIVCSCYAILQHFNGVEPDASLTDLAVNSNMPGRVFSFFENPNSFAVLLVFFLPLMFSMFFSSKKKYIKICYFLSFCLGCVSLALTFSRGAWLAFAFSMCILIFVRYPKYSVLLILVGLLMLPFLPSSIISRLLTIFTGDSSISFRGVIYSSSFSYLCKNPFFGSGFGMEALRTEVYVFGSHLSFRSFFVHTHNLYLELWGEIGIFGLITFLFSIIVLLIRGFKNARNNAIPNFYRWLNAGCVACIGGMLIFSLFEYAWTYPRIMVMNWILISIFYIVVNLTKDYNCERGLEYEKDF